MRTDLLRSASWLTSAALLAGAICCLAIPGEARVPSERDCECVVGLGTPANPGGPSCYASTTMVVLTWNKGSCGTGACAAAPEQCTYQVQISVAANSDCCLAILCPGHHRQDVSCATSMVRTFSNSLDCGSSRIYHSYASDPDCPDVGATCTGLHVWYQRVHCYAGADC